MKQSIIFSAFGTGGKVFRRSDMTGAEAFMNSDRYLFRRNLIEFLYQTRPELTRRLKDTPQLFKGQENPFHMEDSVWTHTMMVLQASLDDPDSQIPDHLCALVHDFGKPFTASVKGKSTYPSTAMEPAAPRKPWIFSWN